MKIIPLEKPAQKKWVLLFENGSTIEIPAESFINFDGSYQFFDEPLSVVKISRMSAKPIQNVAEIRADYVVGVFAPHTVSNLPAKGKRK